MNQRFTLLLYTLFCVAFASCYNPVDLELENTEHQLVVIAEMEEGKKPFFNISTTFSVNSQPEEFEPNTVFVTLMEASSENTPIEFRPQGGTNQTMFFLPGNSYEPQVGETFSLNVRVEDSNFDDITGTTTMPQRGNIETFNSVKIGETNSDFTEIDISLNMSETPDEGSFYHLTPYLLDDNGDQIFPDFSSITVGKNGTFVLSHRHGILIDNNDLDDTNLLEFTLRTISPINFDQLADSNLYFKLNTVAEEYYRYYKSVSKQFETDQSPFTVPVLSYSQFDNGYGVFTAFSSKILDTPIEL